MEQQETKLNDAAVSVDGTEPVAKREYNTSSPDAYLSHFKLLSQLTLLGAKPEGDNALTQVVTKGMSELRQTYLEVKEDYAHIKEIVVINPALRISP